MASFWKSCAFGDVAPDSPLRGCVCAEPRRPRASARGYTRPQLRCSIRKACRWRLVVTHANRSFAALFRNHETAGMRHSRWFYRSSLLQNSSGCGICCREESCPPGARASRPHPLPSDASAAVGLTPEGRCCRRLRGSTFCQPFSMSVRPRLTRIFHQREEASVLGI